MTYVLIGAPVLARAWILPLWFEYIERQNFPMEDIGFVFEAAPNDNPTMECLIDFHSRHPMLRCFDININTQEHHQSHPENGRSWNAEKYKTMVRLRNNLLSRVVAHNPDRYYSLDTDVLLESPDTISNLVGLTETLDAVGTLMYMTPDSKEYPSVMSWIPPTERAHRRDDYPIGSLFQSDIIMASKMMSKKVYQQSSYRWHSQGEDLGWSLHMKELGFKMYCASYIYTPHIMTPAMLTLYKQIGKDVRLFA